MVVARPKARRLKRRPPLPKVEKLKAPSRRKAPPVLPGTKPGSCGANRRNAENPGPCKRSAGERTDHPGQGRCYLHGGRQNSRLTTHGWYSQVTHTRVAEILKEIAAQEANVMDLIPEANLLRAMTIDFVNRYDTFVEALLAWYADPDSNSRPRKVMDLSDAAHLVESISRVVHRMHQIQNEGAISLETFQRVTEHMGIIVARHVKDGVTLTRIEEEWMALALDAKTPPASPSTDPISD